MTTVYPYDESGKHNWLKTSGLGLGVRVSLGVHENKLKIIVEKFAYLIYFA